MNDSYFLPIAKPTSPKIFSLNNKHFRSNDSSISPIKPQANYSQEYGRLVNNLVEIANKLDPSSNTHNIEIKDIKSNLCINFRC